MRHLGGTGEEEENEEAEDGVSREAGECKSQRDSVAAYVHVHVYARARMNSMRLGPQPCKGDSMAVAGAAQRVL